MTDPVSLADLTVDMAEVVPAVDEGTSGQYGAGIGSESEERQLELILDQLCGLDARYEGIDREAPYPERPGKCDLVLLSGMPVEAKLIRYWRANGDPELNMYTHVFSPFHRNTLLTDAERLHESQILGG